MQISPLDQFILRILVFFFFCAGLILVPNGKLIGKMLGDQYPQEDAWAARRAARDGPGGRFLGNEYEYDRKETVGLNMTSVLSNEAPVQPPIDAEVDHGSHSWGIFFTVLGTVLLDFDADACQSPSRAYLLDVTVAGTNVVHTILTYVFETEIVKNK